MALFTLLSKFRILVITFLFIVDLALSVVVYFDFSTYNLVYLLLEISATVALILFSLFIAHDLKQYEKTINVIQIIKKYNTDIAILIKGTKLIYPIYEIEKLPVLNKDLKSLSLFLGEEWKRVEQNLNVISKKELYGDFCFEGKHYCYRVHNLYKVSKKKYRAIIFVQDVTRLKLRKLELQKLLSKYRVMSYELDSLLNALPIPIWKRDIEGVMLYSNDAYNQMVKDAGYDIDEENEIYDVNSVNLDYIGGAVKKVFIQNNKPEYYLFSELPLIEGQKARAGFAQNISELEVLQKSSSINVNTLQNLIDCLEAGVLIVNITGNVAYFNQALCRLFLLDEAWLYQKPSFSSLLDKMNEKGVLPSMKSYKKFKQQQLRYLQEYSEKDILFLYLNNGDSIRITISPTQGGDTLFIYENISKSMLLEQMINEQNNIINIILNLMNVAIVLFDDAGKITNMNESFVKAFNIPTQEAEMIHNLDDFARVQKSILSNEAIQQCLNFIGDAIEQRKQEEMKLSELTIQTLLLPNKLIAVIFNITSAG